MKLSPMMEQYMEIKSQYEDCILFFRLGDFYEMFFEDAKIGSKELELTLTGKNCGTEERAPMCGVPFHAADIYVQRLVEKGYKVAICEQTEDPALAKGLVKRDVIQIVTPGTVTSAHMLDEHENNYIASIYTEYNPSSKTNTMSVCYSDISTGELNLTEYEGDDFYEALLNELVKIKPSEILCSQEFSENYNLEEIRRLTDGYIDVLNEAYFEDRAAKALIQSQFKTLSLTGLGLDFRPLGVKALGALLSYLLETQKQSMEHINLLNVYEIGTHMALDKATIRNLEITETLYEKSVKGSLLGVLDKTHTAMGSRTMRKWLREPLNHASEINKRLDGVSELFEELLVRNNIKESLKEIYDFERLSGRMSCGNANAKDMIALRNSIAVLPDIKEQLSYMGSEILKDINSDIDELREVFDCIDKAIVEDPPFIIKEGGLIKPGFSKELDDLKFSIKDGKEWISNLEAVEKERTGIRTLKVGYNKVFGYYIEVSNSFKDQVPEEYIRKQTLVGGERFITPELKEMENLVLNAEAKINDMEYRIFLEIRDFIKGYIEKIQRTSRAIASLDVLQAFATVSERQGYVKPVVDESFDIEIFKGRHPVIEEMITDGQFVSNDVYLNNTDNSLLLITGPNMSGKSTYMRQTALIVLMAQAGCFVPAESARIGVCDRIFTRIGASDNIASGQSTFYVEMSELSYILNNAHDRSLIILDEIGRGTSTYDGLSIAWASVEHLCNDKQKIRTLFATHYHELTELENHIKGVKNLNVDVAEENGNVVFLHKIVEGPCSRSYGIHVAKIAGIPKSLLDRAEDKLNELETSQPGISIAPKAKTEKPKEEDSQMSLFDFAPNPVVDMLRKVDLMETTPSEAFKILEKLKEALD